MKKILIGGCSFSENKGFSSDTFNPSWTSWSDFFEEDYKNKIIVKNCAQASFGQSKIVESIIGELLRDNFNFDYIIIQWSAIGRAYSTNEKDFLRRIIQQKEFNFAPHIQEYMISSDEEGWNTNTLRQISNSFYNASLNQIYLLKCLLEYKKIPFFMFWGWQQITNEIEDEFSDILSQVYDDNFWRHIKHGGMREYVLTKINEENAIIPNDFHLTTEAQKIFYEDIIRPKIDKIL